MGSSWGQKFAFGGSNELSKYSSYWWVSGSKSIVMGAKLQRKRVDFVTNIQFVGAKQHCIDPVCPIAKVQNGKKRLQIVKFREIDLPPAIVKIHIVFYFPTASKQSVFLFQNRKE